MTSVATKDDVSSRATRRQQSQSNGRKRRQLRWLEVIVPLSIVVAIWLLSLGSTVFYLPPAPIVLDAFLDAWIFERIPTDVLPSLARLGLGLLIGAIIGGALGLLFGSSRILYKMYSPVVEFLRALPAPAILPVLLLLLGLGANAQVALIAFGTTWPILLSTMDGVRSLDSTMRDTVRSMHATWWQRLGGVTLPAVSPHFFAGMKTALSLGIILTVISEMVGGSNGAGYFVIQAQREFDMPSMWAGIILLGIIGYVLNGIFDILERRALAWHYGLKGRAD